MPTTALSKNCLQTSKPRYATPRTESRPSRGSEVEAVATLLGKPLLPWQQHVVDVALETLPNGLPAYRSVVLQVPRQAGKTSLMLAVMMHRALYMSTPQQIAYTAQTGHHARKKWRIDYLPAVKRSPLWAAVDRVALASGLEAIEFKNSSRLEPLAQTASSFHGRTLDLAVLDEARWYTDNAAEAGALPAMATRPDAQLWIVSAAGNVESQFLWPKVEQGRAAAEEGQNRGVCFFEWSAPDDADIDDPAVWRATHPGLAEGLITENTIDHARTTTKSRDEFAQEWLGVWSKGIETVIDPAKWQQAQDRKCAPDGELSFALDVALDRSSASIAVADPTGRLEIIEHREDIGWVAQRCQQIARRYRRPVIVDAYGPAGTLLEPLVAVGVEVIKYPTRDVTTACGLFFDAVNGKTLRVHPSEPLDIAVAGVRKRMLGAGWLWDRVRVEIDMTPLYAATLAHHHAVHKKPDPKPRSFVL